MGQDRNNNYRCDDEHLKKIAQLSERLGVSKSEVMRAMVDLTYLYPEALDDWIIDDDAEQI